MKLTQEELDFIIRGLDSQETRYLEDRKKYIAQNNLEAAQDCLDYFHRVYKLRQRLIENRHEDGTDVAYTLE